MKLNYPRTFLIGLAFMSISSFWTFYDQVIPFLFEDTFALSTFWTNAIMSIDNLLALVMLPLFGALSDRVSSPLGKRSPFIAVGTAISVLMLILLPIAQAGRNFWLFFWLLMVLLVALSTYRSPAVALMPDLTPKPLRSKGNAIINLTGTLGGIYSLVMMMVLIRSDKSADGSSVYAHDQTFYPIFLAVALFMAVTVAVLLLTVRENKLAAELPPDEDEEELHAGAGGKMPRAMFRSLIFLLLSVFLWYMAYNAVTTAFSRYCVEIMGVGLGDSSGYLLIATVVATVSYLPIGMLSGRFGRKKMILAGVMMMTVCYFGASFITHPTLLMYFFFALIGIGWASINVNSFPMVVEMSSSADVGRYTGYYYTFSMAAQITTPLLSGWLISHLEPGYRILFPYAVVFSLLALLTMLNVHHGDVRPSKKGSLLESLDVGD